MKISIMPAQGQKSWENLTITSEQVQPVAFAGLRKNWFALDGNGAPLRWSARKHHRGACCRPDRVGSAGFVVHRSSGMLHLRRFSGTKLLQAVQTKSIPSLILSVWPLWLPHSLCDGFSAKSGAVAFRPIYGLTWLGFSAIFLLGAPASQCGLVAGAEGKLFQGCLGSCPGASFDLASAAVIGMIDCCFKSNALAGPRKLEVAARNDGSVFSVGVVEWSFFWVYPARHCSWSAVARMGEGARMAGQCRRDADGGVGSTDDTERKIWRCRSHTPGLTGSRCCWSIFGSHCFR
jgi:hypothetical protein